jgi:hypothetical protein
MKTLPSVAGRLIKRRHRTNGSAELLIGEVSGGAGIEAAFGAAIKTVEEGDNMRRNPLPHDVVVHGAERTPDLTPAIPPELRRGATASRPAVCILRHGLRLPGGQWVTAMSI